MRTNEAEQAQDLNTALPEEEGAQAGTEITTFTSSLPSNGNGSRRRKPQSVDTIKNALLAAGTQREAQIMLDMTDVELRAMCRSEGWDDLYSGLSKSRKVGSIAVQIAQSHEITTNGKGMRRSRRTKSTANPDREHAKEQIVRRVLERVLEGAQDVGQVASELKVNRPRLVSMCKQHGLTELLRKLLR